MPANATTTKPKRPYRQGRTARAPEARLTPAELAELRDVLAFTGQTFADWIARHVKRDVAEFLK